LLLHFSELVIKKLTSEKHLVFAAGKTEHYEQSNSIIFQDWTWLFIEVFVAQYIRTNFRRRK